ncbi:unnamed protein product [Chondrus crispus]|uniref:Uncharacterized protein n=1 Tax=Chondrus crispus TaxID=2769 RepID=R7Q8W5_CHOCR|nr:unnamed protein product [Chondrus crispus]CDF33915.1 unnamed protein product [Chondrus crispus]|eukprot:XP_005713734.1 unnamed protein product [Chondrus crispus]
MNGIGFATGELVLSPLPNTHLEVEMRETCFRGREISDTGLLCLTSALLYRGLFTKPCPHVETGIKAVSVFGIGVDDCLWSRSATTSSWFCARFGAERCGERRVWLELIFDIFGVRPFAVNDTTLLN